MHLIFCKLARRNQKLVCLCGEGQTVAAAFLERRKKNQKHKGCGEGQKVAAAFYERMTEQTNAAYV